MNTASRFPELFRPQVWFGTTDVRFNLNKHGRDDIAALYQIAAQRLT